VKLVIFRMKFAPLTYTAVNSGVVKFGTFFEMYRLRWVQELVVRLLAYFNYSAIVPTEENQKIETLNYSLLILSSLAAVLSITHSLAFGSGTATSIIFRVASK
jgi:hypothetical protein